MIVVEYRRTLWSERREVVAYPDGVTFAQIAEAFPDRPDEFGEFGAMVVMREDRTDPDRVPRELWAHAKPKHGTVVFVSCVPKFGGMDANTIFQTIGAIALIALVTWVSAGGLTFLGAAFAAGTFGASAAAAAIGVAGSMVLGMLSAPAAGESASTSKALAAVGVSGNPLGAYQQVPAVRGRVRVSPPYLARPYTSSENATDLVVHGLLGLCGPCEVTEVLVNGTPVEDLPDFTYEVLEGWPDDPEVTLFRVQPFEENINQEMSRHITEDDQLTLVEPEASSYPKPHFMTTCRNCDAFRIMLHFPQGTYNANTADPGAIVLLFRLRIRRRGTDTWRNLPELFVSSDKDQPWRMDIRLEWAADGGEFDIGQGSRFAYYSNLEWEADPYFYLSGAAFPAVNSAVAHLVASTNEFKLFLDPAEFPKGQYDVEILRSAATLDTATDADEYEGGKFTSNGDGTIIPQAGRPSHTVIQSYCSFRYAYPVAERGLTMLAFEARAMQVSSVSFIAHSIVPEWNSADWDTPAPSSNPASLLRDTLLGELNARPIPESLLDTLVAFWEFCDVNGLECNALVTDGSVEQVAALVAQCGDAILRRSEKWGVVIDSDRTLEAVSAMFTPHMMTEPLTLTKNFEGTTDGVVPSFVDEASDYSVRELDDPIFDDNVATSGDTLVEQVAYDGITNEAQIRRRAKMDLRRARLRATRYSWGVRAAHLNVRKGDLVGVAHDILINAYAQGRVAAYTADEAGNLTSITLNTDVEDAPAVGADSVFDIPDIFTVADLFLVGVQMGVQVMLSDQSVVMVPVASVSGATLLVDGAFPLPEALRNGDVAAVGPRERETRRVIIADIQPRTRMRAQLFAVDEAPGVHEGYAVRVFEDGFGSVITGELSAGEHGFNVVGEVGELSTAFGMPEFTRFSWDDDGSTLRIRTNATGGYINWEGANYAIGHLGGGLYGYTGPIITAGPYPTTTDVVAFEFAASLTDLPSVPGAQSFLTPGSYSFEVPLFATMTAHAYGGGGAGVSVTEGGVFDGSPGTPSAFDDGGANEIQANGGGGGHGNDEVGGVGGTASGGTTNTPGDDGGDYYQSSTDDLTGGEGGACNGPDGGAARAGPTGGSGTHPGNDGNPLGGGGSGVYYHPSGSHRRFPGGAGGGYTTRTWTSPAGPTPGAIIAITVGTGGAAQTVGTTEDGGDGADGGVVIEWT